MYIPRLFAESDLPTLHAFIQRHSFGLLCSAGADGAPFASHLPFLLDRESPPLGALVGHVARANPHWRYADGKPVLAVFSGPHAYISPAWYEAEQVVPTWNYVAVHAAGVLRAVDDRDAVLEIVRRSVEVYEKPQSEPWRLELEGDYLDRMLGGIVGFRIEITSLEGKWKLSQNQPAERREKVVRGLRARGGEEANAVADLMERRDDGG